jgi:hypothetical protein
MPRLRNPPLGKGPPGVFFICTKGGRGGAEPDPHTNHSRNFRLEDPPQFFGQIFLGKNFGNKNRVVSIPEERVLRQRRSRMKLAGSGEHGVDAITSRVGS